MSTTTPEQNHGPATVNPAKLFSDQQSFDDEIEAFCRSNGVRPCLDRALELLAQHFPGSKVQVQLEDDPEGDARWIVARFDVRGSVQDALGAYDAFKREWIAGLASGQRRYFRFVYNIT